MSRDFETRFLVQHESCECNRRLNESVCNPKQKWNHNECPCECKELDEWGSCTNDYVRYPSTCDFECNKSYKNVKNSSCEKSSTL